MKKEILVLNSKKVWDSFEIVIVAALFDDLFPTWVCEQFVFLSDKLDDFLEK